MFKIKNRILRFCVSAVAGLFSGILSVFSDFTMFKTKGYIRIQTKLHQPANSFAIGRSV